MEGRAALGLVVAQFTGIALVAFGGPVPPAWVLLVLALALGLVGWAWAAMPPRTFTVSPVPRSSGALTQRGPYRFVRHPMYLAVLAAAFAFAAGAFTPLRMLAACALVPVLVAKIRLEERLLEARHSRYQAAMAGVARLVPGIW